jgi:cytochrome P450
MFAALMALGPVYLSGLTFAVLTIFFAARRIINDRRIYHAGGVRANVMATNPLFAIPFFVSSGWNQVNNRLDKWYANLFPRFGTPSQPNVVEISCFGGTRFIMTREPEHVKTVLTSKFSSYGKGKQFHDAWHPFLGDSIFTTDGKLWSDSRSLIRPMFMKDRIRDLEIFDTWAARLIDKLPASGETVDICDLFYRMTLDVTTDYLLGASVNSLEDPKNDFARAFNEVQRIQMLITILSPVNSLIPKYRYNRGIRILEKFMNPYIEATLRISPEELERMSKSDKDFTFLHNIARFTRDRTVIRDQIMAVLIAGRDTTAATLSWTVYELANYPQIVRKLRNVILNTVGSSRMPTYEDLKNMPYLTHTINEALRLYPAVPYNIRAALEDTSLPGLPGQPDITVFKGDIVVYSALSMQRRPDIYPPTSEKFPDPSIFCPERWDHWTPKPWTYVPFNGGPRICVGQNFAMTEMAFCLVRLLQKYERIEYRGDWSKQFHKAEVVGCPGQGVPVALYEAQYGEVV